MKLQIILKLKKLFFLFNILILSLVYLPIYIFIRLISLKILIRFGEIPASRIGHFAIEVEMYLCKKYSDKAINKKKIFVCDIFCLGWDSNFISNHTLLKLFKKKILIISKYLIYPFIILSRTPVGSVNHLIKLSSNGDRDIFSLLKKNDRNLYFSEKELTEGRNFLKEVCKGEENPKFVVLIVRDKAYLNSIYKHKDWSYHDYRDCNIENYIEGCEALTKLGYYVFRMGHVVEKKLNTSNPKIFDYANNGMGTDFLDIFLSASCTFAISTSTGLDYVPTIFRKPVLCISMVPIGFSSLHLNHWLISFKDVYSIELNRNLTLEEIFKRKIAYAYSSKEFSDNKILLKECLPKENKDIFLEMHEMISSDINEKKSSILNESFKNKFVALHKKYNTKEFDKFHHDFNARISNVYLSNRKNFLD
jgi:putative glycosyltransferase (TIGR04372 family)